MDKWQQYYKDKNDRERERYSLRDMIIVVLGIIVSILAMAKLFEIIF